jgi:ATP-dependent DNA helicase RecG
MENYFEVGNDVLVYGKLTGLKPRTMDHPETEVVEEGEENSIHMGRLVPVYPLTEGLPQRWLRGLIHRALQQFNVGQVSRLSSNSLTAHEGESAAQPNRPTDTTREFPAPRPDVAEGPSAKAVPDAHPETNVGQASRLSSNSLTTHKAKSAVQPNRPTDTTREFPTPRPDVAAESSVNVMPTTPAVTTGSLMTGGTPVLRSRAIHMLHCPESLEETEIARQRLALDEFVELQQRFRERRHRFEARARELPCRGDNHLIKPFLSGLAFTLTGAQTRVLREIRQDMGGSHPMRRLLQGDVGSGKTVVAACTTLMALESGYSVALMAPTEILAEQHFRNFQRWFQPLGIVVEMQAGSRKTSNIQHPAPNTQPKREPAALFIGTHALLTEGFDIPKLGLVIIDEQHKFGVEHREDLVRKGDYPHLLVMTATPIPRSLGLTLYGDLDLSVIDELPADRGRIRTHVRTRDKLPKVWEFVKDQLGRGRQAYVVYPRVEETDGGTTRAVKEEFGRIQSALAPHTVAMLHGRMRATEKSAVMEGFRSNEIKALLATSLIEVGVDVANATVMVIEDADRFGLAQLHQLRGRIGRGSHESHCILVAGQMDEAARQRLKILERSHDGFAIAEEDLRLRGPGELLGQQQSGALRLRFGSLTQDGALLQQARDLVMGRARGA